MNSDERLKRDRALHCSPAEPRALLWTFTKTCRTIPWDRLPPLHPWVCCIQLQTLLYSFLCCLPREQGDPFPRGEICSPRVAVTPNWPIAEGKDAPEKKSGAAGGGESEGSEIAFLSLALQKILILTSHLLITVLEILTMTLVALCTQTQGL